MLHAAPSDCHSEMSHMLNSQMDERSMMIPDISEKSNVGINPEDESTFNLGNLYNPNQREEPMDVDIAEAD